MIEVLLSEEDRMIRDATRRWVDKELIPLEQQILRADVEENWFEDDDGNRNALSPEQRKSTPAR